MVKIVVLQRGWVVVGEYEKTADEVVLTKAAVVRRWGTTKGLGEIAGGPTKSTVLDPAGVVRAHPLAVVMTIDCDEAGWSNKLK